MSGGRRHSPEYQRYIDERSPEWLNFRKAVQKHTGRPQCESCLSNDRRLQGAHLTYDRLEREHLGDVIMMCPTCHDKHDNGTDWEKWIIEVSAERGRYIGDLTRITNRLLVIAAEQGRSA